MKYIKINGGKPLQGEISIGGAKNSAVALIPAALLANSKCRIEKIPDISDKDALFDILKVLNVDFKFNDKEVIIDPINLKNVLSINTEVTFLITYFSPLYFSTKYNGLCFTSLNILPKYSPITPRDKS